MRAFIAVACLLLTAGAARVPIPPRSPTQSAASQAYVFPSGAGMLFFYVRPDRTADFESVLSRLNEALDTAPDAVRKQQAAGWRIFNSAEQTREAVIYVFALDPAAATADYDPVKLLADVLPGEAQALYDKLKSSIIRVERMGLQKLR
jgi:hypothetical protein